MAARRGLLALCARSFQAGDSLASCSSSSFLLACESGVSAGIRGCASLQSTASPIAVVRRLSSSSSPSTSSTTFPSSSSSPNARTYTERKLFAYPPHQVFDVVADVQHYDQFVPWCVRSTVLRVGGGGGSEGVCEGSIEEGERRRQQQQTTEDELTSSSSSSSIPCSGNLEMEAELEVGFRNFSERYTSNVTLTPPSTVLTTASGSSLFRHLDCRWRFSEGPLPQRTTWVSFSISFEFKSAVHRHLASVFFDDVVRKMVVAFEGRCADLYGAPSVERRRRVVVPSSAVASAAAATEEESEEERGKLPA